VADPVPPPFPGAVGVSHLRVYDTEAPDGLAGGTPHLHTCCTEAYAVVAGTGTVQTLSASGYAETPLEPGALVWFTPGTVHRLVNGGGLEILVLMQNSGLPEAGDMVITFPDDVLADPGAYATIAALPHGSNTTEGPDDAARARRDLGVAGFVELRARVERDGADALRGLHGRAAALVAERVPAWRGIWSEGALAAALRTGEELDALATGDGSLLASASVHRIGPPPAERRYGCCGTLGVYLP
jgi:mannose-6-phosphate isomerase-like protein (cupin superfamily)